MFPKRHSGFKKKGEAPTHHSVSDDRVDLFHTKFGYKYITNSYDPMVLSNPLWYKKKYGEIAWKKAITQINKTKREE